MEISDLKARVDQAQEHGFCKFNINHDGGSEGIWSCFATDEDRETYYRNKAGDPFEVFLMNHALIVGPSWGGRVRLASSGNNERSSIPVADVIEQMKNAVKSGDYPSFDKWGWNKETEEN